MTKINVYETEGMQIVTPMTVEGALKVGELTKESGKKIGEFLINIRETVVETVEERIAYLNYIMPYTKKSQLKRKYIYELKQLNLTFGGDKF